MKTVALLSALFFTVCFASPALAADPVCDVTGHGEFNVVDIQCLAHINLWVLTGGEEGSLDCADGDVLAADCNCDGRVNVVDIQVALELLIHDHTGNEPFLRNCRRR